jgi:hypothetical protein
METSCEDDISYFSLALIRQTIKLMTHAGMDHYGGPIAVCTTGFGGLSYKIPKEPPQVLIFFLPKLLGFNV